MATPYKIFSSGDRCSFEWLAIDLTLSVLCVVQEVLVSSLQPDLNGDCKVSLEDLLAFATGANKIPALDFPMTPAIQFLNDDSRFPKANTCALILCLPVTEQEFDKFVDNMDFASSNSLPAFRFA
ncbi:hypothetical protein JTB14_006534 [Gonioctena quinquepunctata]|nr:hypothetical protein JTB14_006534 [Gonioctena quinquepunctata]